MRDLAVDKDEQKITQLPSAFFVPHGIHLLFGRVTTAERHRSARAANATFLWLEACP